MTGKRRGFEIFTLPPKLARNIDFAGLLLFQNFADHLLSVDPYGAMEAIRRHEPVKVLRRRLLRTRREPSRATYSTTMINQYSHS
jgi:hypothetical protein